MRSYAFRIACLFFLPLLFSCSILEKQPQPPVAQNPERTKVVKSTSAPPKPNDVTQKGKDTLVAKINGKTITFEEFAQLYENHVSDSRNKGVRAKSKEEFLHQLIADTLLEQYVEDQGIDRDEDFRQLLEQTRRQLLIDYFAREKLFRNVQVTNAEVEQYYNSHLDAYTHPQRIQVRLILTITLEEAKKALDSLSRGESFPDVARKFSIHSSRTNGGLLEPFTRGIYNKSFEDAAFALVVGELSDIIKTDAGYSIIEKTAELPRQIQPLDVVRDDISKILLKQKQEVLLRGFINSLKSSALIETYPIP